MNSSGRRRARINSFSFFTVNIEGWSACGLAFFYGKLYKKHLPVMLTNYPKTFSRCYCWHRSSHFHWPGGEWTDGYRTLPIAYPSTAGSSWQPELASLPSPYSPSASRPSRLQWQTPWTVCGPDRTPDTKSPRRLKMQRGLI